MKTAEPFWNATAASPAFQRVESSLLAAFEGWPKLTPPPFSATNAKRIFQLRIYESPGNGDHVRKVEMFHSGEFEIFKQPDSIPCSSAIHRLARACPTCITCWPSIAWPSWMRMGRLPQRSGMEEALCSPRFSFDNIVDNITNLVSARWPVRKSRAFLLLI